MDKQSFKLSSLLILIVIATIFLIQNTQVVQINLLFWNLSMSTAIMVVMLLVIGILIGWFLKGYLVHKKRKETE
ncbi:hypothetical protein MNBD_IGNAVI01-331 [hydrothermal vent metagenome]|uniref:Lipopolysaccharide assembly protein A domain-containing protein n=1 Tax=hydrothermal vent metagenome TaxID=652676 RepID=A0A3B1DKP1_9ZZZZ